MIYIIGYEYRFVHVSRYSYITTTSHDILHQRYGHLICIEIPSYHMIHVAYAKI